MKKQLNLENRRNKMDKREILKHSERLTFWIIILSIVSLVLISLLPWISITESNNVKDDLFFNYEMMTKSDNPAINKISDQLDVISLLLWSLIIIGLIVLIGVAIHLSGKYYPIGHILLMIGCVLIVSSILILNVQLIIYKSIEDNLIISSAEIFPHFKYSFIFFIISIITFICCAVYFVLIILYLVQKIKNIVKEKKKKDNIILDVENISSEPKKENDDLEIEKLLSEKLKNNKKQDDEINIKNQVKEDQIKKEEKPKSPFKDEKTTIDKKEENTKGKKTDKKTTEKSDISPTDKDIEKIPSDLKDQQKGIPLTVKCPQCKYVFPIEKKGKEIQIECPKCGKTGTIKS
jgi:hypothetical protein